MDFFTLVVFTIIVVLGGILYGIVALTRRTRGLGEIDRGIGTVRRLYFYIVSIVALMMAANGMALVVGFLLDSLIGPATLTGTSVRLATGLSLTVVGIPLWVIHWRIVVRQVVEIPVEERSVIRKVYLYSILGVSLTFAMSGAIGILEWSFGTSSFKGWSFAAVAVFTAVWLYHWRLENGEGQSTPETTAVRRLYLYIVSAVTLIIAASTFAQIINAVLLDAYEIMMATVVLRPGESVPWNDVVRGYLGTALVSASVWAIHWLYFARRDVGSLLRSIYVNLLAIFGGIVTVLFALGFLIYGGLIWVFGVPDEIFASSHFRFAPGAITSIIVGLSVAIHHWMVASDEIGIHVGQADSFRRSYAYAFAGIGLIGLASAIATLVVMIVGIVEVGVEVITGSDLWRNSLAFTLTMGVIGTPLWGWYWIWIQRRVGTGVLAERIAIPRRILIFAVLGLGVLALLGALSYLAFIVFREFLDGDMSTVLRHSKESIGIIVVAAVFLPYHWFLYRADRRVTRELVDVSQDSPRKAVTVIVGDNGMAFVRELQDALGYGISFLQRADPNTETSDISGLDLQELVQRINNAPVRNVLLIPDVTGVTVLSYR
ncbi:MAG: DUF5671 domain-containing protein [SAR202 cluster bacterium]|jgi:hypothetical protein|nr:DUF5671 domain-containing protein [SAR202 cluster bacterium]